MATTPETRDLATLDGALASIAGRTAEVTGADVVVVRLVDDSGYAIARTVHAESAALRAELEGSRLPPSSVPAEPLDQGDELPAPLRRVAEQFGAAGALQLPVREGNAVVGSLELLRRRDEFDERERSLALAAADEIALARRAFGDGGTATAAGPDLLGLAGDALAAGSDETRAADQVATLAAEATGARACVVWRYEEQGPVLAALSGTALPTAVALDAVRRARGVPGSLAVESFEDGGAVVTLQLGEPPQGALQLLLADEPHPSDPLLDRLGTFAVRAAHALRAGERRRTLSVELERTRALLTIVGQAIAQLSLVHTLDTAIEHVSGLLGAERLAVYLSSEPGRLEPAAERELTGPHARVAERLLEQLLGPARGRGLLGIPYAASDPRLAGVTDVLEELGIEAAIAVPLRVRDDLIGLLAVYPSAGRELTENEERLLHALAAQLAVAVQNARLHEETKLADEERKVALESEREASRRLQALYEISRVFSESLSLELTLEAITRTIVETLEVDAASLRMPDARGTGARAGRDARARGAAGRADAGDPLAAAADLACAAKRLRQRPRAPARPAQRRRARPGPRAVDPVPGEGLDGRGDPARHAGGDLRDAHAGLARPGPADRRRDARGRGLDRRARPRSRSTTRASTSSRSSSPTRCSARCSRASSRSPRGSTSAPSTPRRRAWTSAATSTTSSSSRTGGSRSCSATSPATGSTPRPTWRWRSSSSARSRASTPSRPSSWPQRTRSCSRRSATGSSSPCST